jgi:hypothetical protein
MLLLKTSEITLLSHPGDEYLVDALADLLDELCEIRPDDRLCNDQ